MKRYLIIKMGNEFVVQAEERSVLKCTSRRKAAPMTVSEANDLIQGAASRVSDGGAPEDAEQIP
jgi:hypothetical protein